MTLTEAAKQPRPACDIAWELRGSERLTRRFVSQSSRWDVEFRYRWDGAERCYISFEAAKPVYDSDEARADRFHPAQFYQLLRVVGFVQLSWGYEISRYKRGFLERFCAHVAQEARELDASMAAYCASNLWC